MKDIEKTVSKIMQEVKSAICDHYCKYPAIYDTREDRSHGSAKTVTKSQKDFESGCYRMCYF